MKRTLTIDKSLHSFLKHIPDDVLALDKDGTILYVNRPLHNVPREAIMNSSIFQAISHFEHARIKTMVEKVFHYGDSFSFEMNFENCSTKESFWYFCRLSPLKKYGKTIAALLLTTHLEETESALSAQRRLLDELEAARREIRGLKKMITMCAWTGKIKMDGKWVRVEEFLQKKYDVAISHGISEEAVAIMESRLAQGI